MLNQKNLHRGIDRGGDLNIWNYISVIVHVSQILFATQNKDALFTIHVAKCNANKNYGLMKNKRSFLQFSLEELIFWA